MELLHLPIDMLNEILSFVPNKDLAPVSQTCQQLYELSVRRVRKIYSFHDYRVAITAGDLFSLQRHRGRHWHYYNIKECAESGNRELLRVVLYQYMEFNIMFVYRDIMRTFRPLVKGLAYTDNMEWLQIPLSIITTSILQVAIVAASKGNHRQLVHKLADELQTRKDVKLYAGDRQLLAILNHNDEDYIAKIFLAVKTTSEDIAISVMYRHILQEGSLGGSIKDAPTIHLLQSCCELAAIIGDLVVISTIAVDYVNDIYWHDVVNYAIDNNHHHILEYIISLNLTDLGYFMTFQLQDFQMQKLLIDCAVNEGGSEDKVKRWFAEREDESDYFRDRVLEEYLWSFRLLWIDY